MGIKRYVVFCTVFVKVGSVQSVAVRGTCRIRYNMYVVSVVVHVVER